MCNPPIFDSLRRSVAETAAFLLSIASLLTGCSDVGAPSYTLFGAFFPAWMICSLTGIFGAIAARAIFVSAGLSHVLPFQLFVCVAVGIIIATAAWLLCFGR
jgi:YtcA family